MSALEQSMKDFIASNGCVYFSITLHDYGHRLGFNVSAQWTDETKQHGHGIATGDGDTIAEAIERMAKVLFAKRMALNTDEPFLIGGEA